jgi:zinc protease
VLSRATSGTGLVCVQVWARAGSRFESREESGAAHLVEEAALRASRLYPRSPGALDGGAADSLEALGANVGSQTSRDATFYSVTIASDLLPQAMRALSDAVLRPDLSDAALEEAKSNVLLTQQLRESEPLSAVSDLAYRAAFQKHPYAKPAGGALLSVETLTSSRVRAYHKKMYVGRSLSVVIVGDVNAASAHTLAARYFSSARLVAPTRNIIAPENAPRASEPIVRRRPINRAALALAFAAPPVTKVEDVIAMDVLLALWREGSQATLRRALLSPRGGAGASPGSSGEPPSTSDEEEESGEPPLAVAYDVDFLTQRDPGLFIITMALEPGDKADAVATVLREVERVQNGVTEAEVARAKSLLSQQFLAQSETVSGQASSLGFYEMIASYEFAVKYLPLIERVKASDVQRVARTYLSRTKYLQASIEPLPPQRTPDRDSPTVTARRF